MSERINLKEYTQKQAALVSLKVSLFMGFATAILIAVIFIGQGASSMKSAVENIRGNLSYWLQVGDQFQIERTITGLNEHSKDHIYVLKSSDSTKWGHNPQDTLIKNFHKTNGDLYYSHEYELFGSDQSFIGQLTLHQKLPISLFGYLVVGLALVSFLATLMIKILFTRFGKKLIEPVVRLSEEVEKSHITQNLINIAPSAEDYTEIATLSSALSSMAKRMLLQHELELKQELLTTKEDLAVKVAHDIRSPLAALSMILSKDSFDSTYKKIALDSLERISSIANNLLDESKEPSTEGSLALRSEDIAKVINSVLDEKRILCAKKYILFSFVCSEPNPYSNIDAAEFSRIISNIINNSIEALEETGHIQIKVSKRSEQLQIEISDNGCGIPSELLPSLMSKGCTFGKVDGNGLGLYYAKKVLNSFSGTIQISSIAQTGTTVTISIPHKELTQLQPDFVLVEDDEFIRKLWKIEAKNSNVRFASFETSRQLLENLDKLSKTTNFYIDSNLGEDDLGEELAQELHSLGYSNLYMASGYENTHFKHLSFLKGVTGKEVPWLTSRA